ncbi:MAG: sigma-70 family RNA polymerase sigma factor [SAR202 cluster bacterium]|nr:sigma-70 family RNA polymerase sigma factor [SAR202 cluster bacterium]
MGMVHATWKATAVADQREGEDRQLLERTARGEKSALEELYSRYSSQVFSLARYMLGQASLAEEVTQDIFLNIWLKASSFHPERGDARSWIMSVAHHRIVDVIRSHRRARAMTDPEGYETLETLPSSEIPTDVQAQRNIDKERIRAALAFLPAPNRKPLSWPILKGTPSLKLRRDWSSPWAPSRPGLGWPCKNYVQSWSRIFVNSWTEKNHLEELLPGYVLHALDIQEQEAVERHMDGCPECRRQAAELAPSARHAGRPGAPAPTSAPSAEFRASGYSGGF